MHAPLRLLPGVWWPLFPSFPGFLFPSHPKHPSLSFQNIFRQSLGRVRLFPWQPPPTRSLHLPGSLPSSSIVLLKAQPCIPYSFLIHKALSSGWFSASRKFLKRLL